MQIKPLGKFIQIEGVEEKKKSSILIPGETKKFSHYQVLAVPEDERDVKAGSKVLLDTYAIREFNGYTFVQKESIIAVL